jgi:hypothetical protein
MQYEQGKGKSPFGGYLIAGAAVALLFALVVLKARVP